MYKIMHKNSLREAKRSVEHLLLNWLLESYTINTVEVFIPKALRKEWLKQKRFQVIFSPNDIIFRSSCSFNSLITHSISLLDLHINPNLEININ